MFSKCAQTVLCPETLVAVVLCNFFSSLILFLVTLADYTSKFNVSASVHTHTWTKSRSLDQTFYLRCLMNCLTRWSWHLTDPGWRKHIFSMFRDVELNMHACSCLHTCTDCVNSSTVVGGFAQNADESHHLWPFPVTAVWWRSVAACLIYV